MRRGALGTLLAFLVLAAPAAADTLEAGGLRLVPLGAFNQPIQALGSPVDDGRVFVVERGGTIRVVRADGAVGTFLTLSDVATAGEQGLLSMAFRPDYATSGRFFVYYNDSDDCVNGGCDIRVAEYARDTADRAHAAAVRTVFTVDHPDQSNHNGGQVAFGPDGLLYAAPGDGGGAGDPDCDAQRADSRLGKLLRIDPRVTGAEPEIHALGLRNPFRFSFDRLTGDLLLGDVGQGAQEEIDFLPAGTAPGANFGWNVYEGTAPFSTLCAAAPLARYVAPALTYPNPAGGPAAVTGGVVVRDTSVASLLGRYLYADFYAGDVRSAQVGAGGASGDASTGLLVGALVAFGEDARCRVHVTSLAGPVYRLEATQPAGPAACQTPSSPGGAPGPGAAGAAPANADGGGPVGDSTPPAVSRAMLSRRRFAAGRAPTARVARTAPVGTVLRFTLSEAATATVRFYRRLPGRRVGRRCLRPAPRLRRARPCVRWPRRGTLTRRDLRAGRRAIPFSGRLGSRALPPGRYRLTLRARDAGGNVSAGRALAFTVVRR